MSGVVLSSPFNANTSGVGGSSKRAAYDKSSKRLIGTCQQQPALTHSTARTARYARPRKPAVLSQHASPSLGFTLQ